MNFRKIYYTVTVIAVLSFFFWIIFDTKISGSTNYRTKSSLHNRIQWYLTIHEISFEIYDSLKQDILISIDLCGTHGLVIVDINESDSMIDVRCLFPVALIPEQMNQLALEFMQLNNELDYGNYEMDTIGQLLFFRNSVDCRHLNLGDSTLYFKIVWTIQKMEEAIPMVLKKAGIIVADTTNNTMPEIS